jgi:hypothetical protein
MGHGGFKQSGIGREGGIDGLLPFLESKAMLLDGPTSRYNDVLLSPGGTTPRTPRGISDGRARISDMQ